MTHLIAAVISQSNERRPGTGKINKQFCAFSQGGGDAFNCDVALLTVSSCVFVIITGFIKTSLFFENKNRKILKKLLTSRHMCAIIIIVVRERKGFTQNICESGGIGRRARLRGVWETV